MSDETPASLTVEQWRDAQLCMVGHGPDLLDTLYRLAGAMSRLGRGRGGYPCCGSQGVWHWPWCTEGPHDHSAHPEQNDPEGEQ